MEASTHDVELNEVNIADNTLVAPKDGRIQYRIANVGEVLPAGGKVFTSHDISYVYMDVYLSTEAAGNGSAIAEPSSSSARMADPFAARRAMASSRGEGSMPTSESTPAP